MRVCYTQEQLDYLRDGYRLMGIPDLTNAFNADFGTDKTRSQIKAAISNHKFTCGRRTGEANKGRFKAFTKGQAYWLSVEYKKMPISQLVNAFNEFYGTQKTLGQIRAFLKNHKITCGRTGCFEKGLTPWNAGTKGVMKANAGTFQKGQVPPNRKPLWSERIDTKDGYIVMKVPERDPHTGFPTRYKHKHVWIWEQANGPVPEGMVVTFIDGDKMNCAIENLELLHRGDLAIFNKMGGNGIPGELRKSARLVARVQNKSHQRGENGHG